MRAGEVEDVLVAVALVDTPVTLREQVVGDREVVDARMSTRSNVAERGIDEAGVVTLRLLADVADGAADRAAAEQRSLRPAQHFDAVEVDQVASASPA